MTVRKLFRFSLEAIFATTQPNAQDRTKTKTDTFLPAGEYLCLYYHGSLKQTKQLMPSLYAYAREHHLTVTGHTMELCHIDSYETNRESEYVIELELPVSSHPFAKQ